MDKLELRLSSEIVGSYKRLSYKVWYALAEFVDNSTQAYENNREILLQQYKKEKKKLEVSVNYCKGKSLDEDYIEIIDNSIGMSKGDLKNAFWIGKPPAYKDGRSKYGLGMKTAAFWLGDEWSVTTKKLNESEEYLINLDINPIAGGNVFLDINSRDAEKDAHYTIIKIRKMHRRFVGMTIRKIKTFLESIYRFDLMAEELVLNWNEEALSWLEYTNEDFVMNIKREPCRREFSFKIEGKKVNGWAGVLSSGSRNKGGFALVKANRIIQAPPDGYKPESIFGDQEGGRNDLINQRLVGVLYLDGFEVSHTKDTILWEGNEEQELDDAITAEVGDLKKVALEFRKQAVDERGPNDLDFKVAFDELLIELMSPEIADTIEILEVPPDPVIEESYQQLQETTTNRTEPEKIKLNDIEVLLYIDENMSPNDPYVITDSTSDKSKVIIIVNKNHPFWNELNGSRGILNYLRQCVYDGVAEWKAFFKASSIKPDTIKYIKDDLLRVPFKIEKGKVFKG